MIPYLINVLGPAGEDKTAFMRELALALIEVGVKAALLHQGPERAPAVPSLSLSAGGLSAELPRPRDLGPEELAGLLLEDAGVVLSEVLVKGRAGIEFCPPGAEPALDWPGLKAVVGADGGGKAPGFPRHDPAALAAHLAAEVVPAERPAVRMFVGGRRLAAKGFVQQFVAGGVRGMVGSLKGYQPGRPIAVFVEPD